MVRVSMLFIILGVILVSIGLSGAPMGDLPAGETIVASPFVPLPTYDLPVSSVVETEVTFGNPASMQVKNADAIVLQQSEIFAITHDNYSGNKHPYDNIRYYAEYGTLLRPPEDRRWINDRTFFVLLC